MVVSLDKAIYFYATKTKWLQLCIDIIL